ncbi:hypothetical protein DA391_06325 [Yersinia massiliensis]|uniref:Uncharacterized protein n=1 Tax=Yersinia massiliensis TaxID=419257 RepID=A0ABM6UR08_9GAMM|nr:hypothetical protein DA391_06325 [Yersinia massiliensis]
MAQLRTDLSIIKTPVTFDIFPGPPGFFLCFLMECISHNVAIFLHEMSQLCNDAPQICPLFINSLSLEVST